MGRAVNNKLFGDLCTEETVVTIEQLLDYVATYPDDGIIFRKSDMILAAHVDSGFLY